MRRLRGLWIANYGVAQFGRQLGNNNVNLHPGCLETHSTSLWKATAISRIAPVWERPARGSHSGPDTQLSVTSIPGCRVRAAPRDRLLASTRAEPCSSTGGVHHYGSHVCCRSPVATALRCGATADRMELNPVWAARVKAVTVRIRGRTPRHHGGRLRGPFAPNIQCTNVIDGCERFFASLHMWGKGPAILQR